ncbi:MAG: hypothetical protein C4523_21080 [Myxococcales bacterium]|nr:MAG: hypothetical protein C4523_21080 [Myxococcales bacterium]
MLGKVIGLNRPCLEVGFTVENSVLTARMTCGSLHSGEPAQFRREFMFGNCGDEPVTLGDFRWQDHALDEPPDVPRPFEAEFGDYTLESEETFYFEITLTLEEVCSQFSSAFFFRTNATNITGMDTNEHSSGEEIKVEVVYWCDTELRLEVTPDPVSLSGLAGCPTTSSLILSNPSCAPLRILNAETTLEGGAFEWPDAPPFPIMLDCDDSICSTELSFSYTPAAAGTYEGQIAFATDPSLPDLSPLAVQATATDRIERVDAFAQDAAPRADVLFAVDCSGSMADDVELVLGGFAAFFAAAAQRQGDYQFAMISMDTEDADARGRFLGEPAILPSQGEEALSPEEIMSRMTDRIHGCGGSITEAGLEAVRLALSEPLVSGPNAGFLRDRARLGLVFISDENDQSPSSLQSYIDFFLSLAGGDRLRAYALVGDMPEGCQRDQFSQAEAGARYIAFQDAVNPADVEGFYSVCSESFAAVFEAMAASLFELPRRFALSRPADPATIRVFLNDAETDEWTYDDAAAAIVFTDAPPPEAAIEARYLDRCPGE